MTSIIWQNKSATINVVENKDNDFIIEVTSWLDSVEYPQTIIKHLSREEITLLAECLHSWTKYGPRFGKLQ